MLPPLPSPNTQWTAEKSAPPSPLISDRQGYDLLKASGLQNSQLSKLPIEVLKMIFTQLGVTDLEQAGLVCRVFHQLANDGEVLRAVARELNLPIRKDDTALTVRKLLILREMIKNIYTIQPDPITRNPTVVIKANYLESYEKAKEKIAKFIVRNNDHPAVSQLREMVSFGPKKYPTMDAQKHILKSALKQLPPGSWAIIESLMSHSCEFIYRDVKTGEVKVEVAEWEEFSAMQAAYMEKYPNLKVNIFVVPSE